MLSVCQITTVMSKPMATKSTTHFVNQHPSAQRISCKFSIQHFDHRIQIPECSTNSLVVLPVNSLKIRFKMGLFKQSTVERFAQLGIRCFPKGSLLVIGVLETATVCFLQHH